MIVDTLTLIIIVKVIIIYVIITISIIIVIDIIGMINHSKNKYNHFTIIIVNDIMYSTTR